MSTWPSAGISLEDDATESEVQFSELLGLIQNITGLPSGDIFPFLTIYILRAPLRNSSFKPGKK